METIKLDLIPGKKMPSLHASQYDDGREHGIDLFENGVVYKLDGTETLTINERKGDDCICSLDIENTFADSNHIVFASTEQMCAVWGNNICELVIAKGEKTIGTLNFILEIEPSPTENGIESESEIKNLKRQVEAITEEVIGDDYYTKTQTDNAIATATEGKADTTYVNEELAKKADKTDTYTKMQVDNALNGKADKDTTYTKTEVDTLIDNLPEPMIFKGTLGVGGTIQILPTASASNEGFTYKVITDGTYAGQTSKVGDVFTSNGSEWVYIPSGDEDNDTWRAIKVNGVEKLGNGISSGAVDFEDTANVKFEFDANGNKVRAILDGIYTESEVDELLDDKADADNTYTKAQVDDIVYNILPDDTASGSIANFNTSLEMPIKSLEVDVNAEQSAGTPTPSTSLPISGWNEIKISQAGKNLLSVNDVVFEQFEERSLQNPIPSGSYVFSGVFTSTDTDSTLCSVVFVDKDDNTIATKSLSRNTRTTISLELSKDCYKIRFYASTSWPASSGDTGSFSDLQIETGSIATTYEPFNGNTEVINLGGTYYGGHLTQDKDGHRQFEVTHNIVDLGSINWQYDSGRATFVSRTALSDAKTPSSVSSAFNGKCEIYTADTSYNTEHNITNNTISLSGSKYIRIYDTNAGTDANTFKTALSGHYLVYELATPIIIVLPDGQPINTFAGVNNFFADTGDTSVVFKSSVNDYVSAHSGGNLLGMGGVYLGGAKSGGGEEEPDEGEEPKEELKEVTKTLGDEPISKK